MTNPAPEFLAVSRDDWVRLAGSLGTSPNLTYDGLRIEPIYTRSNTAPLLAQAGKNKWGVRVLHAGADPQVVNTAITEDLAGGATSIALQLATPGQFGLPPRYDAIAAALRGVPLDRVTVCFAAGDQYFGAAQCLMALWDETGMRSIEMRGALHADPLGTLTRTGALEAGLWPSLELLGRFVATNMEPMPDVRLLLADATPYHDAGASEAQELAAMLATVVEYLRVLDYERIEPSRVLATLSIKLATDNSLFEGIAKLRSARELLSRVAEACGAGGAADKVRLWATSSQRMLCRQAPHTNILRNTIAALGAVAGGADDITVLPHNWASGTANVEARRLARNTHALLHDESGFARVADPAAGSGYVAALTHAFSERAWVLFQEIEAEGGMAKALLSGKVQCGIAETSARRQRNIAAGNIAIVGVTTFGAADEPAYSLLPHPPIAPIANAETRISALPLRRLAEGFETDHPTTEAHQ